MRIETPYKLWSMAGDLNFVIAGSVIQQVWMPRWSLLKFDKAHHKHGQVHPGQLIGWYFSSVETYGKSLLLKLENFGIGTRYIGCNIGQGCWLTKEEFQYIAPWSDSIYVVFMMSHPDGYNFQLMFYDKKRHGKIEIRQHVHEIELLNRYGPPIDSPYFTLDWVKFVIANSDKKWGNIEQPFHLKTLLMRQEYFAGTTNKMASEICFVANLHPDGLAKNLNDVQIERLYMAVLVVFSTFSRQRDYHEYMIFGRINCPVCGEKTKTYKIQNRITYYCPSCQDPNFKESKPISREYVEEILKITSKMEFVKNGVEQYNERQQLATKRKSEGILSADVSETKDE